MVDEGGEDDEDDDDDDVLFGVGLCDEGPSWRRKGKEPDVQVVIARLINPNAPLKIAKNPKGMTIANIPIAQPIFKRKGEAVVVSEGWQKTSTITSKKTHPTVTPSQWSVEPILVRVKVPQRLTRGMSVNKLSLKLGNPSKLRNLGIGLASTLLTPRNAEINEGQSSSDLRNDGFQALVVIVCFVFNPALVGRNLANTITYENMVKLWFMPLNILITFIIGSALGWVVVQLTRAPPHLRGLVKEGNKKDVRTRSYENYWKLQEPEAVNLVETCTMRVPEF
ncbi:hypothetical protein LguiA_006980 [Lonicera macranthoides]